LLLARKYLGNSSVTLKKISFPDVKSTDWFYKYVQQAFSLKIIEGYSDGKFKPANQINKAESLKIIILSLVENYQAPIVINDPYSDVKVGDWFSAYVSFSKDRQIIAPDQTGKFNPSQSINRGDFAEIIYRLIFIKENKLAVFPLNQNWSVCKNTKNGYVIKYPFDWQKIPAGNQLILWHQDVIGGQVSFARVYPNSAVIVIAKDPNDKKYTLNQYLKLIDYGSGASKVSQPLNGIDYSTVYVKSSGIQDSYFRFKNGTILILYGQVGSGTLAKYLTTEMRYVIGSVAEYNQSKDSNLPDCANIPSNANNTSNNILTQFNKDILVKGKGKTALDLLSNTIIISTDTIGIGTGPIDYYYSKQYNLTAKYERNSDTILAEKIGKTSSF